METLVSIIFTKALQLFLVLDPLGNTGVIATLISGFDKKRQKSILLRETLVALVILLLGFFFGGFFLRAVGISQAAITITGGIIFLLFAISLLFPGSPLVEIKNLTEEPFIVPIATPLVVGPTSLATVILFSHEKSEWAVSLAAVGLAWLASAIIIFLGPLLITKVGKIGMHVAERIIGMVCALVAVKMILKGLKLFLAQSAL